MSLLGLLGRGFFESGLFSGFGSLGLLVTDNADDTGLTATITGADAGVTVDVYTAPWSGGMEGTTWTKSGTRVGNGDVSLDLDAGYYWVVALAYNESTGELSMSFVEGQRASTGDDPLHWQCLEGVRAVIQAMSLDGLVNANVKIRKLPWRRLDTMCPGILITPLTEQRSPVDNNRDTVIWGVQVSTVFAKSNQELRTSDDPVENNLLAAMAWREQMCNGFSEKALAGVLEAFSVHVQPGPIVIPSAFAENYDIGAFLLRCETQVYRGM